MLVETEKTNVVIQWEACGEPTHLTWNAVFVFLAKADGPVTNSQIAKGLKANLLDVSALTRLMWLAGAIQRAKSPWELKSWLYRMGA